MSGWLAVTEKLLGRRANEPPSSYVIDCACGRQVTGARTDAVQLSYCLACGTALFILPNSVYPRPRGLPAEPTEILRPGPRTLSSPPTAIVAEPSVPAPQTSPATPRAKTHVAPVEPVRSEPGQPEPRRRETASVRQREPDRSPASDRERQPEANRSRPRKQFFSPVRIVLLGVVVVSGLTVWWSLRVSARNAAELTLTASVKQAQQALDQNDLSEAARGFQEVKQALDILGRTDPQAQALRQTAAEITASAALAEKSLSDILHEILENTAAASDTAKAAAAFSKYRDQWVLIDAQVTRHGTPTAKSRFEIEFPLLLGSEKIRIVGDLACFERVVMGGSARRVIFAAQLEDCTRGIAPDESGWCVKLRPATAFLWSDSDNLARLGMEVDADTSRVLQEQSNLREAYQ